VPASVSVNQTVSHSFADTLKSSYNKSRLYLIPIIQSYTTSYDTREILNTRRYKLNQLAAPTVLTEIHSDNGLNIYPNPSNGVIYLSVGNEDKIQSYTIYTVDGKMMYSSTKRDQLGKNLFFIPTSSFKKGMYFVKVEMSEGRLETRTFIVQ